MILTIRYYKYDLKNQSLSRQAKEQLIPEMELPVSPKEIALDLIDKWNGYGGFEWKYSLISFSVKN